MDAANLTARILDSLIGEYGYKNIKPLADKIGVFGHVLRAPDGSRVYLVVKASSVWRGMVSCQAFMPRQAEAEGAVVLVALAADGETLRYYMFEPKEIIAGADGFNERLGVNFVNFGLRLGRRFYPERQSVWVERKRRVSEPFI